MLSDIVRELQKARDENVPHMNNINALSDKIINEEKLTSSNRVSVAATDLLMCLTSPTYSPGCGQGWHLKPAP